VQIVVVLSDSIGMACCGAVLVVRALLWLMVFVTMGGTQRTYQRHCECEYWLDGRCAYTLLLPSTNSGDVCPLVNSTVLSRLQEDVNTLQTWTGEQAKAVVTLQNSVNTLTAAVQRLQDTDGSEDSSNSRSAGLDAIKAAVDQLNRTVVELTSLCRGRCGDDAETASLERQLVSKYRLCAVRGLIVNSISDAAITASSVNQSASTSDVRINSTFYDTDSHGGGWCPSNSGESLLAIVTPAYA